MVMVPVYMPMPQVEPSGLEHAEVDAALAGGRQDRLLLADDEGPDAALRAVRAHDQGGGHTGPDLDVLRAVGMRGRGDHHGLLSVHSGRRCGIGRCFGEPDGLGDAAGGQG
jgi:hypothetical protein